MKVEFALNHHLFFVEFLILRYIQLGYLQLSQSNQLKLLDFNLSQNNSLAAKEATLGQVMPLVLPCIYLTEATLFVFLIILVQCLIHIPAQGNLIKNLHQSERIDRDSTFFPGLPGGSDYEIR